MFVKHLIFYIFMCIWNFKNVLNRQDLWKYFCALLQAITYQLSSVYLTTIVYQVQTILFFLVQ